MKTYKTKPIFWVIILTSLLLTVLTLSTASQAAPFNNGSFEAATVPDPGETRVEPNLNGDFTLCSINHTEIWPGGLADRGNNIESWTIVAGGVDWVDGNYAKPPWPGPSDGNRYLDLSSNPACNPPTGTPAGTIQQTFDTTAGKNYEVYFDMSGNPDVGTAQPKVLRVTAANDQADYNFDFPNGLTLPWQEKVFVFTATENITTLTFQSLENNSWGPLLDNVRVVMVAGTYTCLGFDPPLTKRPVWIKNQRTLPVKALLTQDKTIITDTDVNTPPQIQIFYMVGTPEEEDVTHEAYPVGMGTGNSFEYNPSSMKWQYNLKTKNFQIPGIYTIYMVSGDEDEYTIESCEAQFIIE